jgi:hypothetical protein
MVGSASPVADTRTWKSIISNRAHRAVKTTSKISSPYVPSVTNSNIKGRVTANLRNRREMTRRGGLTSAAAGVRAFVSNHYFLFANISNSFYLCAR